MWRGRQPHHTRPGSAISEVELERELDLPRIVGAVDRRGDLPEVCRILVIPLRRSCEVRMIREVEKLRTKLQAGRL